MRVVVARERGAAAATAGSLQKRCKTVPSGSPHVTLLPGDDVENGGDQEERAQPQAVHPGGDPLPAGVRQAVQQRHAHEGRHDEELRWGK